MKTLFLLFALLAGSLSLYADQTIVTATVTVTNVAGTTNGQTITVNGTTRTWTNNVTAASVQIFTNNTLQGAASNMFAAFTSTREPNADISALSTNAMFLKSFPGKPMVVTVSAGWAMVSFSPTTLTNSTLVRVPISLAGNIERTNVESGLVDYLNDNKMINAIETNAPAFVKYMALSTTQSISGQKTFSGANIYSNASQVFSGGTITNANLTNCNYSGTISNMSNGVLSGTSISNSPSINGTVGKLTNGVYINPVFTNGQNYGAPFSSPGTGTGSEQFGVSASAGAGGASAFGDAASAQGINSAAFGVNSSALGVASAAFGANASAGATSAVAFGNTATAGQSSTAIGDSSTANNIFSTALGANATTTADHQVRLGTSSEYISIPGGLKVEGQITNSYFVGTNRLSGTLELIRKNNTSLANGNNAAVDVSTNLYVKVSGPSAAFTINGISGGRDGRAIILQNSTTFVMTIANDSGVDPTAANRIFTGASGDITVTNNPGFVELIYDSATSRWGVRSRSN